MGVGTNTNSYPNHGNIFIWNVKHWSKTMHIVPLHVSCFFENNLVAEYLFFFGAYDMGPKNAPSPPCMLRFFWELFGGRIPDSGPAAQAVRPICLRLVLKWFDEYDFACRSQKLLLEHIGYRPKKLTKKTPKAAYSRAPQNIFKKAASGPCFKGHPNTFQLHAPDHGLV